MTEDEIVGWHHDSMDMSLSKLQEIQKEQGNLACCSPWGRKATPSPAFIASRLLDRSHSDWCEMVQYFGGFK